MAYSRDSTLLYAVCSDVILGEDMVMTLFHKTKSRTKRIYNAFRRKNNSKNNNDNNHKLMPMGEICAG